MKKEQCSFFWRLHPEFRSATGTPNVVSGFCALCARNPDDSSMDENTKDTSKRCPLQFGGATRNRTGDEGFADLCLTAWLWRHNNLRTHFYVRKLLWSGLRGSNPPPRPWQGRALPNELNPRLIKGKWCLRSESNQRHEDFQSSALPTELQRHRKL